MSAWKAGNRTKAQPETLNINRRSNFIDHSLPYREFQIIQMKGQRAENQNLRMDCDAKFECRVIFLIWPFLPQWKHQIVQIKSKQIGTRNMWLIWIWDSIWVLNLLHLGWEIERRARFRKRNSA